MAAATKDNGTRTAVTAKANSLTPTPQSIKVIFL